MSGAVQDLAGVSAFVCAVDGAPINAERDALELVALAYPAQAELVVIPKARLGPDFLTLSTRVAGEVLQKLINYRFRVAILGDLTAEIAASDALRDFVRESNRGRLVWFEPDLESLERRLAAHG